MILISNIALDVFDGSTIASTNIYGADKKVYVNIGSGDVFRLKWNAPTLTSDTVEYYNLVIKRYDPTLNVYYDILNKNIGLVNEFYVGSSMLPAAPEQYLLHIYIVAYSKKGTAITSNIKSPYISKGGGTYVKTPAGYMKRALGFVNAVTTQTVEATTLQDVTGEELQILDDTGNPVPLEVQATRLLYSNGWNIMQESKVKGDDNVWHNTDIRYEILLDMAGGIITDSTGQSIYTL